MRYTNPQAFKLGLLFPQETKVLNNAQARNPRAKAGWSTVTALGPVQLLGIILLSSHLLRLKKSRALLDSQNCLISFCFLLHPNSVDLVRRVVNPVPLRSASPHIEITSWRCNARCRWHWKHNSWYRVQIKEHLRFIKLIGSSWELCGRNKGSWQRGNSASRSMEVVVPRTRWIADPNNWAMEERRDVLLYVCAYTIMSVPNLPPTLAIK